MLIGLTLATHPVVITPSGQWIYNEAIWLSTDEMNKFITFYFSAFFAYFLIVYFVHARKTNKKNR